MKYLFVLLVLSGQMIWSQIQTGTVVYVDFSQDEVTIGADSRSTFQTADGHEGHDDTQCKVFAFGDKFAFAMGGDTESIGKHPWSARAIARRIWQSAATEADATKLVGSVSDKWTLEMEDIYRTPRVITELRKYSPQGMLVDGFFAATDRVGHLVVRVVDIRFDVALFDSKGVINVFDDREYLAVDQQAVGGLIEIINESKEPSTKRAKDYMSWFMPQLSRMPPSQRHAALTSKLIELSILLHPDSRELGFPIDVLQLRPTKGIHWISRKTNCPIN